MQEPPPPTTKPPQKRLRRFIRQPDRLQGRQLTTKGLQAVAIIERYRFLPTSLLVRLMPGDQKNNPRCVQTLFHQGLVNRFALPKYGGPGEFIYYLDSRDSLTASAPGPATRSGRVVFAKRRFSNSATSNRIARK